VDRHGTQCRNSAYPGIVRPNSRAFMCSARVRFSGRPAVATAVRPANHVANFAHDQNIASESCRNVLERLTCCRGATRALQLDANKSRCARRLKSTARGVFGTDVLCRRRISGKRSLDDAVACAFERCRSISSVVGYRGDSIAIDGERPSLHSIVASARKHLKTVDSVPGMAILPSGLPSKNVAWGDRCRKGRGARQSCDANSDQWIISCRELRARFGTVQARSMSAPSSDCSKTIR